MSLRTGLCVAVMATVTACSPARGVSVFPPALSPANAIRFDDAPVSDEVLLQRAQAWERNTGDFSAVVSVRMRDPSHGLDFTSEGGLAVRRPSQMRMQLLGPGGVTALDLLATNGTYLLRLAGKPTVHGTLDERTTGTVPAAMIARMVLGLDWSTARTVSRDNVVPVLRLTDPQGTLFVTLDPVDSAVRELRWFTVSPTGQTNETARMLYDDLAVEPEHPNDPRHPQTIVFVQAKPFVEVTLTVRNRTLHPELPARTFEPFE